MPRVTNLLVPKPRITRPAPPPTAYNPPPSFDPTTWALIVLLPWRVGTHACTTQEQFHTRRCINSMLEVRNLTKLYIRRPAVDDVSFTIRPGEILGYLGPNGSGKSTTVKMLTGLLEPSRGLILYQGRNIRQDLIGYKKSLGYVPEEPNLYPYLTGREYLHLVGRLRCLPAAPPESKTDQLSTPWSPPDPPYSPTSSYSKGMKQKILISAASRPTPVALVFAEPLSG